MGRLEESAARRASLARVAARRERHRHRPFLVRVVAVGAGFLLGLVGLAFVWWLPELGLPLLIAGLGLLALEFEWAARTQATVEWRALVFRRWWGRLPAAVKVVLVLGAVAAVAVLVWVIIF